MNTKKRKKTRIAKQRAEYVFDKKDFNWIFLTMKLSLFYHLSGME